MPGFYKVVGRVGAANCVERIDEDELNLHLVGNQALDVDAGVLTGSDSRLKFRKPSKMWGKFHKDAVRLHRAHDAGNGLPRGKAGGIFLPGSQQLLVAEQDAEVFLDSGHDGADVLTGSEAVAGVRDAGDRNAVDGNEGWDAATDIHKAPERLQMGDPCGDDVAGSQGGQQLLPTEQLSLTAGENGGNAPGAAVADADGSFTARDASLTEAKVHNQVMLLGADNGARL